MKFLNGYLSSLFNKKAVDQRPEVELPKTDFCAYLTEKFGRETAAQVVESFQKMGLPAPQKEDEFMEGAEGGLVFLNKYGLSIRIESADFPKDEWKPDRINDSGWVIQPLATLQAGSAIIEICPGCNLASNRDYLTHLKGNLESQGSKFFDVRISNIGHLPVKSPSFPDGVPVVIDRLAVQRLTNDIKPASEAIKLLAEEAALAQKTLYAPLREAFAAGYQGGKMDNFWNMCRQYVAEGKLVAGWTQASESSGKPYNAARSAKTYALKCE